MKKTVLILTFIVISFFSYAQNRVNIPGTKVWMVPPEGAKPATNFMGFTINESSIINVMDLVGGNFYKNTANFKKESFEEKGMEVLAFENIKIENYDAISIHIKVNDFVNSFQVTFGDSTFSAMIMTTYPSTNKKMEKLIKKSVLSATYKKNQQLNPFKHTFFRLDDTKTRLKFSIFTSNLYSYTIGGRRQKDETTVLILIPLPYDGLSTPQSTCKLMFEKLKDKGFPDLKEIDNKTSKINGYEASELTAKGLVKDKMIHLLIQVIRDGENQVIVQCIQRGGKFDKTIFTELTNTIRFK